MICIFRTIKLYKIEDNDVSLVSEAPLKQEMLESNVSLNINCKHFLSFTKINSSTSNHHVKTITRNYNVQCVEFSLLIICVSPFWERIFITHLFRMLSLSMVELKESLCGLER